MDQVPLCTSVLKDMENFVEFEILMAITMKSMVFSVATACSLERA
jgi:hypothetical protein